MFTLFRARSEEDFVVLYGLSASDLSPLKLFQCEGTPIPPACVPLPAMYPER